MKTALVRKSAQFLRPSAPRSRQKSLDRVFLPVALGQALAALETLTIKGEFQEDGYLRGFAAQRFAPGSRARRLAELLDHPSSPKVLAGVSLAASTWMLVRPGHRRAQIMAAAVLVACNGLAETRTPYGRDGADQMSSVIAQYRLVTALVPDSVRSDELFLGAVNFQTALSYAVSGLSKAFGSSWLQGDAVHEIVQTEAYGRGPLAGFLRERPALCRALTWSTVAWELGFVVIYRLPSERAALFLAAVKFFHVGVAASMELPRFVWGFFAAHGAVEHTLSQRSTGHSLGRRALLFSGAITVASAILARERRRMAREQRRGPKGASLLQVGDVRIEYKADGAGAPASSVRPVVLLEAGLGQSFYSLDWLADELADDHTVIRYHRDGYGATSTGDLDAVQIVHLLLDEVGVTAPHVVVTHSIGSLAAAQYLSDERIARDLRLVVLIDPTDPGLLADSRADRRRLGGFLQGQLSSLFAAVTGIYQWVPHAVGRQAGYEPDTQFGHVEFAFEPSTIATATREFFRVPVSESLLHLSAAPVQVVASSEFDEQQRSFAHRLGADFRVVMGSTHRSIVGDRRFAREVVRTVREAAS